MERNILLSLKPKLYRSFFDGTYKTRKKNVPREPSSNIDPYHPDINLTIGINPSKILDNKLARKKNEIRCFSHRKDNKLSFHWKFVVTKIYWNNVKVGGLYRGNISCNLQEVNFHNQSIVFKIQLLQWIYWPYKKSFSSNQTRFFNLTVVVWRAKIN